MVYCYNHNNLKSSVDSGATSNSQVPGELLFPQVS